MADTTQSTASQLASLSTLAPLIINMLKGTSQPNPGALLGTIPGGQDLLNGIVGQQQQQAPLRQAVTQQAMNMLPGSAFPGGRPALSPVGAGPAAVQGGGGTNWPAILAAAGGGAGLGALLSHLAGGGSGGGGPLSPIADALKKLLGIGGNTLTPTSGAPDQGPNPLGSGPGPNLPPSDLQNWLNPGGTPPPVTSGLTPSVTTDETYWPPTYGGGGEGDQGPAWDGSNP